MIAFLFDVWSLLQTFAAPVDYAFGVAVPWLYRLTPVPYLVLPIALGLYMWLLWRLFKLLRRRSKSFIITIVLFLALLFLEISGIVLCACYWLQEYFGITWIVSMLSGLG